MLEELKKIYKKATIAEKAGGLMTRCACGVRLGIGHEVWRNIHTFRPKTIM
jgi:hypothetical protein